MILKFKIFVAKIILCFIEIMRNIYYRIRRIKLKNKNVSIISRNCIGGCIYHNLGLQFLSPTINLFFEPDDYIKFINNLKHYINCTPVEVTDSDKPYPVGELVFGEERIKVYFMHYPSFENAKECWVRRAKRVNYDNICFINEWYFDSDDEAEAYIKRYNTIPYEHRIMLNNRINGDKVISMGNEYNGVILHRKNPYKIKRPLDDFDYVSFLNSVKE